MASRTAPALSNLLLWIAAAAVAFSATVLLPSVQAETYALRRDLLHGPASPDFFVGYLDDRRETLPKATRTEDQQAPRLVNVESDGNEARYGRTKGMSRILRDEEDRFWRNLDQIGGGNLLRRGLQEERNLDHIGGGNLVREVDPHQRNLEKIGGGNLLRQLDGELNGVLAVADHLRRNLDQIGGGNLVRGLAEARRPMEPPRSRAAEP